MFRDAKEELKRLEEELLSEELEEETGEEFDEEDEEYDEAYDGDDAPELTKQLPKPGRDYQVYNSDKLDTDLDAFSEAVQKDRSYNRLAWVFALVTAGFVVMLYLYLRQRGYL